MASVVITREPRVTQATAGSLAYDLSYIRESEAEITVPGGDIYDPEPAHVRRARAKESNLPLSRMRPREKIAPVTLVGFVVVGLCLIMVLLSHIQLMELSDQVVSARRELSALQEEGAALAAQYENAFDMTEVERLVTQDGVMIQPRADQIYYIDLGQPDNAVIYDGSGANDGAGTIANRADGFSGALSYFQ